MNSILFSFISLGFYQIKHQKKQEKGNKRSEKSKRRMEKEKKKSGVLDK